HLGFRVSSFRPISPDHLKLETRHLKLSFSMRLVLLRQLVNRLIVLLLVQSLDVLVGVYLRRGMRFLPRADFGCRLRQVFWPNRNSVCVLEFGGAEIHPLLALFVLGHDHFWSVVGCHAM